MHLISRYFRRIEKDGETLEALYKSQACTICCGSLCILTKYLDHNALYNEFIDTIDTSLY